MGRRKNRKRDYVPLTERLAASLAMLLSPYERDVLRGAKAPAEMVLKLFHFDHNVLHALGGSDKWWNLSPVQVQAHREKSRRDVSAIAKVDRIIARQHEHREAMDRLLRPEGRPRTVKRPRGRPMPGSVASGLRKKLDGSVVKR